MRIFCDFDGTISINDTTDVILNQFALPEWEAIETQWKQGFIGSAECMQKQIGLIRTSKVKLDSALDSQEIDPYFPSFIKFCEKQNLPVTVISDGVDYFIQRILARHSLSQLPIIANRFNIMPQDTYSLSSPYTNPECRFKTGVCKCQQLALHGGMSIFVGDGRSDFCAATKADLVFAKTSLAIFCEQQNILYIPYQNFTDVQRELNHVLSGIFQPSNLKTTFV